MSCKQGGPALSGSDHRIRGPTPVTQRGERPGTGRGRGKEGATGSVKGEESQEVSGHPSGREAGGAGAAGWEQPPRRAPAGGPSSLQPVVPTSHLIRLPRSAAPSPPNALFLKGLLVKLLLVFTSVITVYLIRKRQNK